MTVSNVHLKANLRLESVRNRPNRSQSLTPCTNRSKKSAIYCRHLHTGQHSQCWLSERSKRLTRSTCCTPDRWANGVGDPNNRRLAIHALTSRRTMRLAFSDIRVAARLPCLQSLKWKLSFGKLIAQRIRASLSSRAESFRGWFLSLGIASESTAASSITYKLFRNRNQKVYLKCLKSQSRALDLLGSSPN